MLVVGDNIGIPQLLRHVDRDRVVAIMGAEIRPQSLIELGALAGEREIPLLIQPRTGSPEYPEFVSRVKELAPDLLLCDSYSMLLPADLLAIPSAGAVNVHGGLLPEYRGSNPIQWAILEGRTEAGVTMHYMDAGFDSGDIIASRAVPILFTDTWVDVRDRIGAATESLLAEQIPLLVEGRAGRHPQDESKAQHHRRRKPEDGRIDWHRPVREIYNLIRALVAPLPGAFYVVADTNHQLDRYLTVAQVAALKQQLAPRLADGGCQVRIVAAESNDPLVFEAGDGRFELTGIDYDSGQAALRTVNEPRDCDRQAILDSIIEFARSELQLSTVRVEP